MTETIRYAGQPVSGFAIGAAEDNVTRPINEMIEFAKAFASELTPRETIVFNLGLTASHLEESIATGEWKRAEAHVARLKKLLKQFESGR